MQRSDDDLCPRSTLYFLFIYPGHTKRAISVSISADGFRVVSLAKDSLIKVHSFIYRHLRKLYIEKFYSLMYILLR